LAAWRARVAAEATTGWAAKSPLASPVRVTIINFHSAAKPGVDVDNVAKPIHDVMNGVVYSDDRQVGQAEITHSQITTPLVFAGVSKVLVNAVQAGTEFVYIRVSDVPSPYPLPR
jgi:Holliday junction resolvase RusA-like endonuclease